ncbi:MAG TPA: DUF1194 domain-containing protein [Aestuariivirgaceae bacterium]|nr:DUF1194 domain-containing protein [Aestuariivirgaceae bacterium]
MAAAFCRCLGLVAGLSASDALAASAETPVALELVIAVDTSASVDAGEFELQVKGLSQAFASPEVIAAIESLAPRGMAVALVQWSGSDSSATVLPFHEVYDARTAKSFGFLLGLMRRLDISGSTAIGLAIEISARLLATNAYDGERRIIDVSGDGRSNDPPPVETARDRAVAAGVTINGLAILSDDPRLDVYYRRNVIGGQDAFVEVARDFDSFAHAIRQKLIREIYPPLSLLPRSRFAGR